MLPVRIALRYLFSKKSHTAVNIISYVSIAGVAIAAAAMVIVLSVFNGFADFAAMKLSLLDPPLLVEPLHGKTIANADSLVDALKRDPAISDASAIVQEHAFAIAGERQTPLTIKGIDPDGISARALPEIIIDGDGYIDDSGEFIPSISSIGVANTLRTTPSFPVFIKLYEPRRKGRLNPSNPMAAFRTDSVLIAGVFRVEQAEYDNDILFIPLSTARNLLSFTTEATAIEVASSGDDAKAITAIKRIAGPEVVIKDRNRQQEQSFKMIQIEKWVTLVMLAFILVIASFNILSTMSMLIIEKRNNRMILITLGATPDMISHIYAWLSFIISSIGVAIGLILGSGLSLLQQFAHVIPLSAADPSQLAIDYYPIRLAPADLLIVLGVTLATGAITAWIIRSVTRNPAKIFAQ